MCELEIFKLCEVKSKIFIFNSGLTRLVKFDHVSLKLAIFLVLVIGYMRFAQPASLRLRIDKYRLRNVDKERAFLKD